MVRIIVSFLAGFALGILAIWLWNAYYVSRDATPIEETTPVVDSTTSVSESDTSDVADDTHTNASVNGAAQSKELQVQTQPAGEVVIVDAATMPQDGWIVVHELFDGIIANALGAARYDAGAYTALSIPLLRTTDSGKEYAVVLYNDDGDRAFNMQTDVPLTTSGGIFLFQTFTAQ